MVKIYKTQSEIETDIKNGVLVIQGDVKFECSVSINASIKVISGNIDVKDIRAWDINADNIDARDINAEDIRAWDIDALDINAKDIRALNIDADNIVYNAFCSVYNSIKCLSVKASREVHSEPVCLEGKVEIKKLNEIAKIFDVPDMKIKEWIKEKKSKFISSPKT